MTATSPKPESNRLIESLPRGDRRRFLAGCDQVELVFAEVLTEAGESCRYVYFPTGSFISLVAALDDERAERARLEVGIVGDEGMFGTSLVLGVTESPLHALVQGAGKSFRMSSANFRRELERSPMLRQRLNRYVHVLMNQLAQTAICTRYHVLDARLARWLLVTRDRAHSNQFHLTHEFMAYMLGVRRVGVTKAAGLLEELGVIDYSRGNIRILDEPGLADASCGCYRRCNEMYEEVLGPRRAAARHH